MDIIARAMANSIGKTPNSQTWTASANQTLFTITNGTYVPNKNLIEVVIDSVPQFSGVHFTETNSTSFTVSEPLIAGQTVRAKWNETKVPSTIGHSSTHAKGGNDEIDITLLKNYQENVATPLANMTTVQAESATVGNELVDATGWTSTGWTGNFTNGYQNTVGQTSPLRRTIPSTGTNLYLIKFHVDSPSPSGSPNASTDFTVSIGNSPTFLTYKGGGSYDYAFGIQSISDGDLVITPGTTFDGTIKNISIKQILSVANPTCPIKDSSGLNALEIRPTNASLANTFIGANAGEYNVGGDNNVGIGTNALLSNTTGFWNTAVGAQALTSNTTGSRNVAMGYLALNKNTSGVRNVAVGNYSLPVNTIGNQNIAVGSDSLIANTTGSYNVSIGGQGALSSNTTGQNNIAIGTSSLSQNTTTNQNIAVGVYALQVINSHNNIGVGYDALMNATTGGNNVGIGSYAGRTITTGGSNTFIGYQAGYNNNQLATVANSIAIGSGTYTTSNNGLNIGNAIYGDMVNHRYSIGTVLPDNNTYYNQLMIGGLTKPSSLDLQTSITANAGEIGAFRFMNYSNVDTGAGSRKYVAQIQALLTTGNANVNGDSGADLLFFTKGQDGGTFSEKMRIKANGRIGIGQTSPTAYLHLPSSTGGINTAPIKFAAGTLLSTVENGALEFDGTDLYITTNTGVRKKITSA